MVHWTIDALCVLRTTTLVVRATTARRVLPGLACRYARLTAVLALATSGAVGVGKTRFCVATIVTGAAPGIPSSVPGPNVCTLLTKSIFYGRTDAVACTATVVLGGARLFHRKGAGWPRDETGAVDAKALIASRLQGVGSSRARLTVAFPFAEKPVRTLDAVVTRLIGIVLSGRTSFATKRGLGRYIFTDEFQKRTRTVLVFLALCRCSYS